MTQALDTTLSRIRLERKMTQIELAAASGLNNTTIARIETGRTSPKASTILAIAQALDVDPVDYFRAVCGLQTRRPLGLIATRQLFDTPKCSGVGDARVSGR